MKWYIMCLHLIHHPDCKSTGISLWLFCKHEAFRQVFLMPPLGIPTCSVGRDSISHCGPLQMLGMGNPVLETEFF